MQSEEVHLDELQRLRPAVGLLRGPGRVLQDDGGILEPVGVAIEGVGILVREVEITPNSGFLLVLEL